jgi:hypothetical protein
VSPAQDFDLPVSLDRIRGKLEQPSSLALSGVEEEPDFKVEVQERQRIEDLIAAMFRNVKPGPIPPEGVHMKEMERNWGAALSENPLMEQPYSSFNGHEIVTLTIENVVGRLLADPIVRAVSRAQRAAAEDEARTEVRAAIAEYCTAQPNRGAGIEICGQ